MMHSFLLPAKGLEQFPYLHAMPQYNYMHRASQLSAPFVSHAIFRAYPCSTTCFRIIVLYIFNYISSHKIADINPLFHNSLRIFRLRNRHRFAPFCYKILNRELHIIHYQHIKEAGSVIGAFTDGAENQGFRADSAVRVTA